MGNQLPGGGQCCQTAADGEGGELKSTDEWAPALRAGEAGDDVFDDRVTTAVSAMVDAAKLGNSPGVFSLELKKSHASETLGLDLLHSSDGRFLFVEKIAANGLVARWNQQQDFQGSSARKLREGDHILRVNDAEADNGKMIQEFRTKGVFNITVYRKV